MLKNYSMKKICIVFMLIGGLISQCTHSPVETLLPRFPAVDHHQVKVEGELGRRMDLVMHTNIPKIDLDSVFLEPFRYKSAKEYYPDDYFCCPNNYRRIISDLPELIYYQSDQGIAVNLYNRSKVSFEIENQMVHVSQETSYPSSGEVIIVIEPEESCEFEVKLRISFWCKNPSVSINGSELQEKPVAGNFYSILRKWNAADHIKLVLPMEYRFVRGRGNQWDKVALMRGPVVYGINNKDNPLVDEKTNLTIDPGTISAPYPDDTFRPGGLKCTAQLLNGTSEITFTEFIDPSGIKSFFHIPPENYGMVTDDALVAKQY